jgi:hypothetical protein
MRPTKPSTPSELAVIAWAFIVLLTGCGAVAFYFSSQAGPDQAQIAQQLRYYGVIFFLMAGLVFGVQWVLRRWVD